MSGKHSQLTPHQQCVLCVIHDWWSGSYPVVEPEENIFIKRPRQHVPISPVPDYLIDGTLFYEQYGDQQLDVKACLGVLEDSNFIKQWIRKDLPLPQARRTIPDAEPETEADHLELHVYVRDNDSDPELVDVCVELEGGGVTNRTFDTSGTRRRDSIRHYSLTPKGRAEVNRIRGDRSYPREPHPLVVNLEKKTALLHGEQYALEGQQAEVLGRLLQKEGGWVTSKQLREFADTKDRIDRLIKNLPPDIRSLIISRRGTGYRLPLS